MLFTRWCTIVHTGWSCCSWHLHEAGCTEVQSSWSGCESYRLSNKVMGISACLFTPMCKYVWVYESMRLCTVCRSVCVHVCMFTIFMLFSCCSPKNASLHISTSGMCTSTLSKVNLQVDINYFYSFCRQLRTNWNLSRKEVALKRQQGGLMKREEDGKQSLWNWIEN